MKLTASIAPLRAAAVLVACGSLWWHGTLGAQESGPVKRAPAGSGPVTVAGRVVDSQSRPISAAKIVIEVRAPDGQWDQLIWDDGDTYTDFRGAFEIRRPLRANESHRVTASKDDHWLEEPIEFTPGKTGVEIILSPAGAIKGSFLLDPSVYARNVTIEVRRELLPHETQEDLTIWHPREDGTFKLSPLRRGKYGLRVTVDQGREILLDVEPVSVRDGETNEDRRLQGVDFRMKLRGIGLTIVDEKGKKVEGARVVVLPSLKVSPISHDIFYSTSERVFMLVRQVPIDVAVVAPGYARVKLKNLAADQTVVMKKGIPVKVTLTGGARIPEAPIFLQASLELEADMKDQDAEARRALGMEQGVDPISFDANGVANLTAPGPGRYVVLLSIVRKVQRVNTAAAVPHATTVLNVGTSATDVTINVPPHAVERALGQVGVK
jgi:hypothetical protein